MENSRHNLSSHWDAKLLYMNGFGSYFSSGTRFRYWQYLLSESMWESLLLLCSVPLLVWDLGFLGTLKIGTNEETLGMFFFKLQIAFHAFIDLLTMLLSLQTSGV